MSSPAGLFERMEHDLTEALERVDDDEARYHIRAAAQRAIIAEETVGRSTESHN